jgi:hypothetical protein
MNHRFPVLATLLILTSWLVSCQQLPQPTVGRVSPSPSAPISTISTATPIAFIDTRTLPATPDLPPLAITVMRAKAYPGSDLVFEKTLSGGSGYNRYIVSYQSDGLKLFGLLTIPTGVKPIAGWPVILLNHGYIPPREYSTDQSYAGIVAPLATAGYIVFKPDYRGHDNSPGIPYQIYVSPAYLTDSLNALASIKMYKDANPNAIGVWGHSMGGNITLHELVIAHDIKAIFLTGGIPGSQPGCSPHRMICKRINSYCKWSIFMERPKLIPIFGMPLTQHITSLT